MARFPVGALGALVCMYLGAKVYVCTAATSSGNLHGNASRRRRRRRRRRSGTHLSINLGVGTFDLPSLVTAQDAGIQRSRLIDSSMEKSGKGRYNARLCVQVPDVSHRGRGKGVDGRRWHCLSLCLCLCLCLEQGSFIQTRRTNKQTTRLLPQVQYSTESVGNLYWRYIVL
jgi:hypothetical protein